MPKLLRNTLPDEGMFHITNRGNNQMALFRDEDDFNLYYRLVGEAKKKENFRLYHYALMTNHIHLQIETETVSSMSRTMKSVTEKYAMHFRRRYSHKGHVWQGRFKSSLIDNDPYALTSGIYIELNPVRANMVQKPEDYRWSSYKVHAYGENDPLVDELLFKESLGFTDDERLRNYRTLTLMWMKIRKRGSDPK